jgi:hypothetical protein
VTKKVLIAASGQRLVQNGFQGQAAGNLLLTIYCWLRLLMPVWDLVCEVKSMLY